MGEEQRETAPGEALAFKNIQFEVKGAVGHLFINRPQKMNTLSIETLKELTELFEGLLYNREVKVVLITSAGEKVFVAGADINELYRFDKADALWFCDLGHRLFNTMELVPAVLVAVIDGYCMGGGFDFSMACDIRIASDRAKIAHTACKMGIITGFGGTQRLKRLIHPRRAKELFFTAKLLSANEAKRYGIVHEVFPHQRLMEEAERLAKKIAERPRWQIEVTKALLNRSLDMNRKAFMEYQLYTTLARC